MTAMTTTDTDTTARDRAAERYYDAKADYAAAVCDDIDAAVRAIYPTAAYLVVNGGPNEIGELTVRVQEVRDADDQVLADYDGLHTEEWP